MKWHWFLKNPSATTLCEPLQYWPSTFGSGIWKWGTIHLHLDQNWVPFGNRTWQWKVIHLRRGFPLNAHEVRRLSITVFDLPNNTPKFCQATNIYQRPMTWLWPVRQFRLQEGIPNHRFGRGFRIRQQLLKMTPCLAKKKRIPLLFFFQLG